MTTDNINPKHYRQDAFEGIEFTLYINLNLGNAFKHVWLHKEKGGREDLEKAVCYLERQCDDVPNFRELKVKKCCERCDKLRLIGLDIDHNDALGAILYAAADCSEDNISWALACVKTLLNKMQSETEAEDA